MTTTTETSTDTSDTAPVAVEVIPAPAPAKRDRQKSEPVSIIDADGDPTAIVGYMDGGTGGRIAITREGAGRAGTGALRRTMGFMSKAAMWASKVASGNLLITEVPGGDDMRTAVVVALREGGLLPKPPRPTAVKAASKSRKRAKSGKNAK